MRRFPPNFQRSLHFRVFRCFALNFRDCLHFQGFDFPEILLALRRFPVLWNCSARFLRCCPVRLFRPPVHSVRLFENFLLQTAPVRALRRSPVPRNCSARFLRHCPVRLFRPPVHSVRLFENFLLQTAPVRALRRSPVPRNCSARFLRHCPVRLFRPPVHSVRLFENFLLQTAPARALRHFLPNFQHFLRFRNSRCFALNYLSSLYSQGFHFPEILRSLLHSLPKAFLHSRLHFF